MKVWKTAFDPIHGKAMLESSSVLTLGNFDGIHVGHRRLIGDTLETSKKLGLPAIAVTFDPHPSKIISPSAHPSLLMTSIQKMEIFEKLGLDAVWVIPFGRDFSVLEPLIFLDVLAKYLNPVELHVGKAFRFGRDRIGDATILGAWGRSSGCVVHIHAYKTSDGGTLSSSRIRHLLAEGEVHQIPDLLGTPFRLTGVVIEGERRGRLLGFPTANLAWEQEQLPAPGVYVTAVHSHGHLNGPTLGLTNVGLRPTFGGTSPSVETHLPNLEVNLYGKRLALDFLTRIRSEEKMNSPGPLKIKIADDIRRGTAWWTLNVNQTIV